MGVSPRDGAHRPGKEGRATARHPRALTCAWRLRRLRPARPLRCAAAAARVRSQVRRLGPGPSPGPRAPHASPLAGAAPQMRLREEEPRGPGSPRAAGRGRGAGRCARGRGPRGCAQNQARIRPPARGWGVGWGGAPLPAPTPTHAPATRMGGGGSPRPATLGREPEGRLEIRGRPPRESSLLAQGHTAWVAVAREPGTPGYGARQQEPVLTSSGRMEEGN